MNINFKEVDDFFEKREADYENAILSDDYDKDTDVIENEITFNFHEYEMDGEWI